MAVLGAVLVIAGAFLAGSIPWGVVLGRIFSGVDIRNFGSKSTGSTNALRVFGWRISLAVLILDSLKGLLPVLLARWAGLDAWIVGAVGVATVVGHCWSPWIRFRGGKGVATSAGAAFGMAPWLLLLVPVMILIVWLTRYVSLGSIVTAVLAGVLIAGSALLGWVGWAWVIAVVVMSSIIIGKHHTNIRRLLTGTERRFGEPARPM